jgi:hypothetical protein
MVTGLLLAAPTAAGAAEPDPYISVSHVKGPGSQTCLPARQAASGATTNTSQAFTLIITAVAPICEPVTAAVYSMPSNMFYPWPQNKVESTTFDVEPGVTTIRFVKGCEPVQFDVVTGRTPDRINPTTGPMHGPLLFEWFPWSALQHWGGTDCSTDNTTTTSTTTSTTTTTTTTTVASQTTTTVDSAVEGTTTIVGQTTTTPAPSVTPQVQSATTLASGPSTSPSSVGLAVTGGSSQGAFLVASAAILAGIVLLRLRRVRGFALFGVEGSPFTTGTEPNPGDDED